MWAKLKQLFSNRWVLSALGLLILSLLIWFAGDAIAIYEFRPLGAVSARLGLIVLIALTFVAWEAWKHWRAKKANEAMLAAMAAGGESSNAALSQREVAELKGRFDEALKKLRTARFDDKAGGGRNYLYQLPWYIFIGAPGSGKTTALINSGLRFPLSDKPDGGDVEIKGVGGTRNCDWWFTDQAVLLDTAGRYTTQSSNQEVDAAAWQGFLGLLKRFRPRQPLNGALITLSVKDLLTWNESERLAYAREVRTRVQELYRTLGVRFPLYVLVTKCDLLAGFTEFFSDQGREARAQVWGMTFPYKPAAKVDESTALFGAEFDALVSRLNGRVFNRMEDERDVPRRALIFAFPQQFAILRPLCESFLREVFQSSAFSEEPMLRGVYFTSGTQDGSSIDRVLGNISRSIGLERQSTPALPGAGRSYFITHLLGEVVFGESDLGGRNAQVERRNALMAAGAYVALGVLTVALLIGWTLSFLRNQNFVAEYAKAADGAAKLTQSIPKLPVGDVRSALPALEAVAAMPGATGEVADVPLSQGLGLFQGHKLGSQAANTYANLLRDAFLPRIGLRLEAQMRDAPSPEVRYEALKAYLMLYDAKHLKADELEAWVVADWSRSPELRPDLVALTAHLQAALKQPLDLAAVLPINRNLVDEARRQLASSSLAERSYSRLKRIGVADLPDFKLNEAAGPSGALVFGRASGKPLTEGLPAMFTLKGYHKAFHGTAKLLVSRLAEEESWVLGPQAGTTSLAQVPKVLEDVQRRYLNEYITRWDDLLQDLRLLPADDLQRNIQNMMLLSAGDSPLRQLLQAVARETRLASAPVSSVEQAGAKLVERAASSVREGIEKLLGDTPAASAATETRPEAEVEKHFERLHRVVLSPPGSPESLDKVLAVLKEYEVFLRGNQQAAALGTALRPDADIKALLKAEVDRLPPPVSGMLNNLVSSSGGQAATAVREGVQKRLAGEVAGLCKPAIEGRYPFARGQATREVPLGDFNNVFRPGGVLDTFAKTNFTGLVDMAGPVWKALKADGVAQIDDASVANFQRAAVIRDAFFPGGAASPQVQADLILAKADEATGTVVFKVDEQETRLNPAASGQGVRILWPSLRPAPQLRVVVLNKQGAETASASYEGAWGVFRLMDAMKVEGGTPDRLLVSLNVGTARLQFEMRSASVRNPLRLPELAQFRCPG